MQVSINRILDPFYVLILSQHLTNKLYFFGRAPRCARVGLFRTTLTLGANALPNGMLHIPHASGILIFNPIRTHTFALPCISLIFKCLED
ncbi:MAG: hypothetical protein RML94_12990 [Bacteroidia bacterium]|nr:hypothetical protein [Bacteroidia bacterium]